MYTFQPRGVCASKMEFELKNGIVTYLSITGGCSGNLQGICSLVAGQKAHDVIGKLKGIACGPKSTSCPDQLASALSQALAQEEQRG